MGLQTNGQPGGASEQSPQQQQPNASSPQSGQPQSLNDVSMYGAQYSMAYGAGGYYGAQNPGATPGGYGAYPTTGNAYAGYQQVPQQDPPQQQWGKEVIKSTMIMLYITKITIAI